MSPQGLSNAERLDMGQRQRRRIVGCERQTFFGRQLEVLFRKVIPDWLVDALGIEFA
jgi:hypothetical protein